MQYIQECFLFTQELINFTQENLPLLLKKLRTPYSRNLRVPRNYEHLTQEILPLLPKKLRTPHSRNFTFIIQEITNTSLNKYEGP